VARLTTGGVDAHELDRGGLDSPYGLPLGCVADRGYAG